jgi:hypothetical protein
LTAAELTALIISGLSLLIALVTLYRAELRGPSVKLRVLEAPRGSSAVAGWSKHTTDEEGDSFPNPKEPLQLTVSGTLSMMVENTGTQAGVLSGLTLTTRNLPSAFAVTGYGGGLGTRTVDGKSNAAFLIGVALNTVVDNAAQALDTFQKLPDKLILRVEYRSSRPWGRIVKNHAEASVAKRLFMERVAAWAKNWTPKESPAITQ